MTKFIQHILFATVLLTACTHVPEKKVRVHACASMPEGRASACACVCDGKAYVFGGRDHAGTYLNDLWQYDPATDSWTDLGTTPLKARVNAAMASCGDKLYVGLGYSALRAYKDSAYQQDWWEYSPATNQWKSLAQYPSANTVKPVSYCVDNRIYVLYGCGHAQQNEVWQYDPSSDTWTQLPHVAQMAPRAFGCTGAAIDGTAYFGSGFDSHNLRDWYRLSLPDNRWTACASLPGKGREFSACAASKEYVYVLGGRYFGGDMTGGEVFDSFLRYAADKDQWEWCGTMPCGRAENQIAFAIDGKVYFGLGEDEKGQTIDKIYRIED